MGPLSKDDDPGGKYYRVLGAGKVSESTALGSRLGYNRDFKGILYIWRPKDGSEMATTTTMPGIGIEDSVLHCVAFNLRNVFLHSAKGSGRLQPHRHTDHADP